LSAEPPKTKVCPFCGKTIKDFAVICGYCHKELAPGPRLIKETRCTCAACGNVWHYGKMDSLREAGNAMQDAGKAMMCCTGCLPAVFIPTKTPIDLNKCPKCGSRAVTKEIVEHQAT
jgi:hypothetical protein